jgi:hypothetical protein
VELDDILGQRIQQYKRDHIADHRPDNYHRPKVPAKAAAATLGHTTRNLRYRIPAHLHSFYIISPSLPPSLPPPPPSEVPKLRTI